MATLQDRLRDPVWQFISAVVAVAALVLSIVIWVKPNVSDPAEADSRSPAPLGSRSPSPTPNVVMVPAKYQAAAPGPECDKGEGRWTLKEGKVSCVGDRAVYDRASVWLDWPGRKLAPSHEITLHAEKLEPTTCVRILVRSGYGLDACAMGDVGIFRLQSPAPIALAGKQFAKPFTYAQMTVRVEGTKLTLTVYTNSNGESITLTVSDDAFKSEEWIEIDVYSVSTRPAKATLFGFQYRALAD